MSDASDVSDSAQEIDHLEVVHGLSKCAHTTHTQREAMGLWMEVESNRTIYLGESTAGAHGTGVTKREGFKRMASYVHTYAMKNEPTDRRHSATWDNITCQSYKACVVSQESFLNSPHIRRNSTSPDIVVPDKLSDQVPIAVRTIPLQRYGKLDRRHAEASLLLCFWKMTSVVPFLSFWKSDGGMLPISNDI
ncbi:hypothetical protein GQ600_17098 [Phytophthora cactorum]|nr:hypothetical protein GQ600_17098 [Phytophthora cactorum]